MNSTKPKARLIIPLWGAVYAQKLVTMTLPAVLAPGNLPSLCESFDVELVLVTEAKLFDSIRAAKSFQAISQLCSTKFIPIDDLMTDLPGDYGPVLTYALYRGFIDLGAAMTETYLLFLNADFIISNGSLRSLGKLMLEGKRVIHAPSFRAILEEVWPRLEAKVDKPTMSLAVSSREMVKLAFEHKHITVRARTVNQRLCHQWRMDQFYWQVDENTLIGYQWPVALVAIKPERAVTEPNLVWDYAFVPEAAPNLPRHFISDSDDFFMLEPQKRGTGEDLVRLGWIAVEDIVRDLNKWTTKEQRDCGKELLVIHSGDLPAGLDTVVAESRDYLAQIFERLDPNPQPYIGHGLLGEWFKGAKERMRRRADASAAPTKPTGSKNTLVQAPTSESAGPKMIRCSLQMMRAIYRTTFGEPPEVKMSHPLWGDTHRLVEKVAGWKSRGASILWLSSGDSLFHRMLEGRIDPTSLTVSQSEFVGQRELYDACLCELTFDQLADLRSTYGGIRSLLKNGGEIVVSVENRHLRVVEINDIGFFEEAFPDLDLSTIGFSGSSATGILRRIYLFASGSSPGRQMIRALFTSAVLIGLSPIVWMANRLAAARDPEIYRPHWTSLVMEFKVRRPQPKP